MIRINLVKGKELKAGKRPMCPRCKEGMTFLSREEKGKIYILWLCAYCGWEKHIS
jgi:RNase P subunit RPR2